MAEDGGCGAQRGNVTKGKYDDRQMAAEWTQTQNMARSLPVVVAGVVLADVAVVNVAGGAAVVVIGGLPDS